MFFHDFSWFSMVSLSKLLRETIENLEISWKITKKNNSRFFRDFFVFQKKSFEKIFLPISIRNLLRNPKIILRKSCGEFKDPYQKKSKFFYNVYSIFDILMYMLSITTLYRFYQRNLMLLLPLSPRILCPFFLLQTIDWYDCTYTNIPVYVQRSLWDGQKMLRFLKYKELKIHIFSQYFCNNISNSP